MTSAAATLVAGALLLFPGSAPATILWSQPGATLVCNNGQGEDLFHGAVKPQDSNSTSTLYFRFHVDPLADSATKSIGDFDAGFMFFEHGEEHFGLGNSREAWAYCAVNITNSLKGYVDLNSATPEPGFNWEYMRTGTPKYIAFKVEYVPGHNARVTAWLNPNLSLGATEINQPTNIVTRFEAKATFDEIRLLHRGGKGGWKFSQLVVATSFEDLLFSHFWQRGWFFAVAGGGLLVGVAGTAQLLERRCTQRQIRRLERESAVATERARIARDIHDELGASLTKIHKLAEMLDEQNESRNHAGTIPRTISRTARDTIQTMDEIVWAVNPKNDTLKEMADYLVYFTQDFLQPSGIACSLDVPLKLPDLTVTAEVRHNVFMVVKEALNNAVKHAAAQQVRFAFDCTANQLSVEIADNGRGFSPAATTPAGNGLENMRRRMGAIGGEFDLQSEPGCGTTVRLRVLFQAGKVGAP
ncbi:MAG: Integral rane sensor signal transduction histidine kinase [Pedosphaera sp.]|nr:Integral rane sensor signal transduction histidine kinase [Pedosphaera sp.]